MQRSATDGTSGVVARSLGCRRRVLRLRLDELEPRVSPSSLLSNVPFLWTGDESAGVMVDGSWLMVNENDATTQGPSTISHQPLTIPSSPDSFSPVVPSELQAAESDAPRRHGEREQAPAEVQGNEDTRLDQVLALLPVPEAYAVGDFMRTFATWDESAAAADGEWQIADGRWRMDDEASEGTGQAETGIEETVVRAESTPAGTPAPRATEPEANVEDAPWRVETASQRDLDNLSRFGTLSHPFGVQRLAAARALGPFWTERVHRQAEALQNRAFRATQPDSSVESASQRDPDEARVSPLSAKAKTLALRAAAKSVSRQPEPGPDGFWLTQVVPTGDAGRPFDTLEVHFSQAVQDGSFTVDDVQFTGPGGPIAPSALTQVEADEYELEFSGLTGLDAYTLVIGPDIANGSGALMDQDHDGTPGEAVQDAYTARLAANGMTLGATDTQYDGWNLVIYGNTATIDGAHAFGGLEVLGGATLTHSPATETAEYSLNLTIRDTLWVDAGANINASGRGYLPGRTIGNTTEGAAAGQAGGSYAGLGGTGAYGGTPNQTYGDYANPNELGSGGGSGGAGGGLVRITAGSAQIDGSISANGGAGGWNTSGGSGGGVFLDVGSLSGSGTMSANGGTGTADPGGGSGGRVAVYYDTLNGFDLTRVTAYSGSALWGNAGGVGTVYLKQTGQEGLLRLDNGAMTRGGITPLGLATDTVFQAENLVLSGSTVTAWPDHAGLRMEVNNLSLLNGATLTHQATTADTEYSLAISVNGSVVIDSSSKIDVSGRGYLPGRTIGNTTEGAAVGQAGGSYGGLGGTGARGGTPNQTYGDYANPNELGSGGGYGNVGGGLVRITAGSAQIDGSISANGGAGGWNTSGGSGGGVFLDVGALSGSGTISANGGTGIADPGGGSGGRVAMYYDTLSGFDLTRVTAYSGSAWWGNAGGVGTVYLKETGQEGLLRLDNGAMARGGITPLGLSTDTVFQAENLVLSGSTVTAWPDHAGLRMEVSNLSLLNGATLTHQATTANTEYSLLVSVNGTLAIDATSRIDVSGRGYLPGRTVGNTTRGAATWGSGGSYGGIGGMGYWAGYANVTNRVYGDYRNPDEVGSGGGAGGSGGGLARITAGAAVIDGAVLANGSAGGWNTPGGSGGGLLLNVGTLSGGGTIAANGGPGHLNGGSGSGGRVAIYDWTSMTLPADNVSAQGGTGGYGTGQDGSVFITSTDRFLLWNRMANQLFHGVERLSWSSLGLDPAAVTVDILASSAGTVRTLGTGLLANGSLDWNTTSAPDGVYELRGIVRDASGAALVEGTLHVTVNNALGWHSGQIASDETWTADRVHMVEEDVTVATGARLTIAPGAIVKFAWQTGITVADGAFLDALGTEAAPIVLTAWADDTAGGDTNLDGDNSLPQPGEWAGLGALGTGQLNLNDYAELRYIATTHTGTLLGDETWMGTFLHRVSGEVVVPTGATLIISPGAIVKFEAGAGLTVQTGATLSAQSSLAQPIIFTSIKDDRFAGDTNLDGDLTRASAGDWRSIRVDGGAGLFNHAEVFYGGNSTVSVWGAGGMLENLGTITFENGVVSESLKDGILGGGTTTIRNSLVLHNDRGVVAWGSPATIMNSTMDDNRIGVLAHGGTPTVVNSIISNSLEYGVDWDWGSYAADVRYSDVWNSGTADFHNWFGQPDPVVGVNGVISADPLYKNRDKGDYRLNYRSPAIDAGDGGVAPAADRMGAPRYDDPRTANTGLPDANAAFPDLGAYEFVETAGSDVDLIVNSVSGPSQVEAGQEATVRWRVTNTGTGVALGPWHNAITVVADAPTRSVFGLAAGEPLTNATLGPGESADFEATVAVPGGTEGPWRWQVRVNSRGEVFEGANWTNNASPLSSGVQLSVPSLATGTPYESNFVAAGHPAWFKMSQAAGEQILVTLDGAATTGRSRLYAGFGSMPTEQSFDLRSSQWNSPDASLGLPAHDAARTVYLLVVPESITGVELGYALTVQAAGFGLQSIDVDHAGNAGTATLLLRGSGFDSTLAAQLRSAGGQAVVDAQRAVALDSTAALVTFALDGVRAGLYDLIGRQGSEEQQLAGALQVTEAQTSGPIQVRLIFPELTRIGREFTGLVQFTNPGNDLRPTMLTIRNSNGNPIWYQRQSDASLLQVLAIPPTGPTLGFLRPRESSSIPFHSVATADESEYTVHWENTLSTDPIDWAGARNQLRPSDPPPWWDAAWDALVAQVGATDGQFIQAAAQAAAEARSLGLDLVTSSDILGYMLNRLQPTLEGGTVYGAAYDTTASRPVANKVITLTDTMTGDPFVTRSWYDGQFAFWGVPAGTYRIAVEDSWVGLSNEVTVPQGQILRGLELSVTSGHELSGRIVREADNQPLEGVQIHVDDAATGTTYLATTDDEGRYRIGGLRGGTVLVSFMVPSYVVPNVREVTLEEGRPTALSLSLSSGGAVEGLVRNPSGGAVGGATVQAQPIAGGPVQTIVAGDDGSFRLTGLASGAYQIVATAAGYGAGLADGVTVAASEVKTIEVALTVPGRIQGVIRDAATNEVLAGARVSVTAARPTSETVRTDETGAFTLNDLAPGTYLVEFNATGYLPAQANATVTAGADLPLNASLRAAGVISGTLQETGGRAVTGSVVTLRAEDGWQRTSVAQADGLFRFGDLSDAAYLLTVANRSGVVFAQQQFTLNQAQNRFTTTVNYRVGDLSGLVRQADGLPAPDVQVALLRENELIGRTSTDREGRYHFDILEAGAYDIAAVSASIGFQVQSGIAVSVDPDQTAPDIVPAGASLTITVDAPSQGLTAVGGAAVTVAPVNDLLGASLTGFTSTEGQTRIEHLAPGNYLLVVLKEGLAIQRQTVAVGAAPASVNVSLLAGQTIRGTVRDEQGQAVQGAVVTMTDEADGTTLTDITDERGNFEIISLAARAYDVWISDGVRRPVLVPNVTPAGGVPQTINVILDRTGFSLEGAVQSEGTALPGVAVLLAAADGTSLQQTVTDHAGQYEVGPVSAGQYRLEFTVPGLPPQGVNITVTADQTLPPVDFGPLRSASDNALPAHESQEARALIPMPTDLLTPIPVPERAAQDSDVWRYSYRTIWSNYIAGGGRSDCANAREAYNGAIESAEYLSERFGNWFDAYEAVHQIADATLRWYVTKVTELGLKISLYVAQLTGAKPTAPNLSALQWGDDAAGLEMGQKVVAAYDEMGPLIDFAVGTLTNLGQAVVMWDFQKAGFLLNQFNTSWSAVAVAGDKITNWLAKEGTLAAKIGGNDLTAKIVGFIQLGKEVYDYVKEVDQRFGGDIKYALSAYSTAQFLYMDQIKRHRAALAALVDGVQRCGRRIPPPPPPPPGDTNHAGDDASNGTGQGGTNRGIGSQDPNDKVTVGLGQQGWITGDTTLLFTIRFENVATATAPAQEVRVTDQLDPQLDWTTFQLQEIGFNNVPIRVAPGLQSFSSKVNVPTDPNPVRADVALDPDTGQITWTMQSLDPVTGQFPEDPLAGFLPPNDDTHRGEGFVTYTIRPKAGLPTGAEITNQARIVFDVNPPIDTNETRNTIDVDAPTSAVAALPATQTRAMFWVNWGGSDTGAGIAAYDLYSATDGGPYALWLDDTTDTSAAFTGAAGHSYAFYSVARDNVGYAETAPGAADATTTVTRAGGPQVTALSPNPGAVLGPATIPSAIVATFDSDLDPATVTANTFKVSSGRGQDNIWGTADDVYLSGTVAYDAVTDTGTFTPSAPLTEGDYAVWLSGNVIADPLGNRLDGEWPGSAPGFPSGDGDAGGDFLASFAIDTTAPRVQDLDMELELNADGLNWRLDVTFSEDVLGQNSDVTVAGAGVVTPVWG
ncbi:MAG: hypothetical protein FJ280_08190, partial [Planctomycetes bacterium]|nr:hypothetical protein [Planctomycetota bacterium]